MAYKDKEKQKAWSKAWYEANKDKKKARSKAWNEANKDKKKARDKAWNEANKDKQKSSKYFRKYPCATKEDYTHYLSVTHCECCGALLTNGNKEKNSKCQDHDHVTGKIRGVICQSCNIIEGILRDRAHYEAIGKYMEQRC